MFINEMIALNNWIIKKENEYSLISKLEKLKQILVSNTQIRSPNMRPQQQPFTKEKNEAVEAMREYRLSELSDDQIACLSIYDANHYIDTKAAEYFLKIFSEEVHDLAYLGQEVSKAVESLNSAKKKIAEAAAIMKPYASVTSNIEYLGDKARFSIIFKDGVKVETLKDLELRSKEWSVIIHGIGVALNIAPNEFKVLGARNGSLIIDLFMYAPAIIPIGFILNRSLAIIERFALSLKKIGAIYELDLDDPAFEKISKQIEATNEEYFNLTKLVSAKKITKEILDEYGCEEDKRSEAETHLESSVKKILNHLKNGGDLDAFIPESNELDEQNNNMDDNHRATELIESFRHKKLELSKKELLKLLEHFDFEDNPEQ